MTRATSVQSYETIDVNAPRPASRQELIDRYRHYRSISRQHHNALIKLPPKDSMLRQTKRLGLLDGRKIVLESIDDMCLVFDLLIHTAPPNRTRTIDRYVKSGRIIPGSDEWRVACAMQQARFSLFNVVRRHETAGLMVFDVARQEECWLVDENLERSLPDGTAFASRLVPIDDFTFTAGVFVPIDRSLVEDALYSVPFLQRKPIGDAVADPRFAEAIYRTALADGVMAKVQLLDTGGNEIQ